MFAPEWRWQGVWHSFPFLAWDLSMHPRTNIWFLNQFICTWACACSSNLNYAHKCIENSANVEKCPNEPRKIPKLTQKSCCSMLTREIFESNKRQWISFRPQRWGVPYRNHHPCCEKLWSVRSIYPNLPQMGQKNYQACWCRSMIACQVSWISESFGFTRI